MNLMKFCPECNNLLYSEANKKLKVMISVCLTCCYKVLYKEAAMNYCVYRNELTNISAPPVVLRDAHEDPTLPRVKGAKCPACGHPEVVFFLANPVESMVPTYVCCNPSCGHNWTNEAQKKA